MTTPMHVLVTGATGNTASPLIAQLAREGVQVTAASRNPPHLPGVGRVQFDWHDEDTHEPALRGIDRMYLVPPPLDPDPAAVMVPFVKLARERGIRRVVLLSSSALPAGGPAAGQVHAALPTVAEEWAVLRPSWFMQNFTRAHVHATSIQESGTIMTGTGTGRVGFIDVRDIAAVAADLLTCQTLPDTELILTGPETLSYDDVARIWTEETGRSVAHHSVSKDAFIQHLSKATTPQVAAMLADLDTAVSAGAEDRVTDTVEKFTGNPPRSLVSLVREQI